MTDRVVPAPSAAAPLPVRVRAALVRAVPTLAGLPLEDGTGLLSQGLGIDSVETLAVAAAVEEEFDVTIDDAALRLEHFANGGGARGVRWRADRAAAARSWNAMRAPDLAVHCDALWTARGDAPAVVEGGRVTSYRDLLAFSGGSQSLSRAWPRDAASAWRSSFRTPCATRHRSLPWRGWARWSLRSTPRTVRRSWSTT